MSLSREQYTELDHGYKQVSHLLVTKLVHQISTGVGISLLIYGMLFSINLSHLHCRQTVVFINLCWGY